MILSIAKWCVREGALEQDDEEIINIGLQLLLNTSTKVLGLLVISFFQKSFFEFILILTIFGLFRKEAGGVHCKTNIGCFIGMLLICEFSYIYAAYGNHLFQNDITVLLVLSIIFTLLYAPRNSSINPITKEMLHKKRIRSILVIIIIVGFILLCPAKRMKLLVIAPTFIETITLLPQFYGGEENEKAATEDISKRNTKDFEKKY